jgi:predicted Co/Zn/Cd cation transporter (cation efflux family)
MKEFIKYTLVWVSSNLAIPFWTIGHIHLSINVYEDIHEILMSCGMNIIVLIGFIIEYKKEKETWQE